MHVIITATDAKYGTFLVDHWLKSLRENVDLAGIQVVVIDYGLPANQALLLESCGVLLHPGRRDGHVSMIRYREICAILKQCEYDQALFCDSGDIIFQEDIAPLFTRNKGAYRAACEDIKVPSELRLREELFIEEQIPRFRKVLKERPQINAGFLLGPRTKMEYLAREVLKSTRTLASFGPDQIVANYVLHTQGFQELDSGYNLVVPTSREAVTVEDGVFFFRDHMRVPVVHNAGNHALFRPVRNFGYGNSHNHLKPFTRRMIRMTNVVGFLFVPIIELAVRARAQARMLWHRLPLILKRRHFHHGQGSWSPPREQA
jgi:hypothetical protein